VQPSLQGVPARPAILVFALAAGALLSYQAARLWLAYHRIHSTRLEMIERGAALEPGDADAWDLLGRYRQLDFANADPKQELADYQRAVQDDPLSATFWMNLAGAYEENGDLSGAESAFERARSVYPLSAEVAWDYGNFLLRQGKEAEGYAEIHHAVQSDPKLLTLAVSRVWRSSRDVNVLLDQVLPPDVDAYFQALDFFASIRRTDAALVVWHRLLSLGKIIPLPKTFPFFDELIQDDRSSDAKQVWVEALAAAGGALSSTEAARQLGISRQAVEKRRRANALLAVRLGGDWRYPRCQFDEARGEVVAGLPKLLGAYARAGPWVALDFLLASDEALGGETPLQVLRREGLTRALERLARIEQGDGFA